MCKKKTMCKKDSINMLSILVDNVYFLDICKKLQQEFGLKVSEATVQKAKKKLGWIKSGPEILSFGKREKQNS